MPPLSHTVRRALRARFPRLYRTASRARARLRWLWALSRQDREFFERQDRQEFLRRAFLTLAFNGIAGDYAEFGCASGTTFTLAHREARNARHRCRLWAFDSFQGLPAQVCPEDAHPQWTAGSLAMSLDAFLLHCARVGIPQADYEMVAGFYDETIGGVSDPAPARLLPDNIALAYVDCDLYSSTRTVLGFLRPRLKHGMILAFDDWYCYSTTALAGERRAFLELEAATPGFRFAPYVQFGWHGMSFIVEDVRLHSGLSTIRQAAKR